ncbi:MAG TPA: ORF6N domain-containing protein [Candidatus Limnocylindria bacterium]|nr:ORF6N domain-containing protein [Candidatus Limnocylindria bacterium]
MIIEIRGARVLLDSDLADLYGVSTGRLNEAVRRNIRRFPDDFMFQLTQEESANLISQFAISSIRSHGGRRTMPRVFTQEGVAMLSGVLHSSRAITANVEIMRAFVRLRRIYGEHAELVRRLDDLEGRHDAQFKVVFDAIRALMKPPAVPSRDIGFRPPLRTPVARSTRARASGQERVLSY